MLQMWKMTIALVAVLAIGVAAYGVVAAQTDDGTPTATESPEAEATATETEDAADTPTAEAEDDATTPDDGNDATDEEDDANEDDRPDKGELRDAYLAQLAQELGISQEDLEAALTRTALAMLDEAVADGRISEDEAAEIRERIESGEVVPFGPFFGRHHAGHVFGKGFHLGVALGDLAEFLGVEEQVVAEGLRDGQSLAQIAEANGKSRDDLRSYLLSQLDERLSEAVADEDITQEEADEKRAEAEERIDDLIDREEFPGPGPGFGGHEPRGGFAPFPPPFETGDEVEAETTSLY
jgi:lambda repressor-like predicted transcriptional regulator